MTQKKTFRIGICMAGAVSAGAYTAGVIDYLLESLENWYEAKRLKIPGVPQHDVIIEVFSGASAGGMTAAITAGAIQKHFPHVDKEGVDKPAALDNPLFNVWVNMTEKKDSNMMSQMLESNDILDNAAKEVKSIFNSEFIKNLASDTIDNFKKDPDCKRNYIADDLEIVTTLTNLRGLNYKVKFKTALGESEHLMLRHLDIAHFQLNESGIYNNDGKIPLHFNDNVNGNRDILKQAAMATGAFPVGLAPRQVHRKPEYIDKHPYLNIGTNSILANKEPDYNCVTVDGGLINNEPFGITDKILQSRRKLQQNGNVQKMEKSASMFDTTVIMIDPFPNYETKTSGQYTPMEALKDTLPAIFKSMRQQLMFKGEELENAYDENNYTRFMVVPIRRHPVTKEICENALACGGLSGFSGFFKREFRIHDFLLGRRNAQRFIQKYFSVPIDAKNPIIEYGYKDSKDLFLIEGDNKQFFLPIIPDLVNPEKTDGKLHLVKRTDPEKKYDFPAVKLSYIVSLEEKLEGRFNNILKYMIGAKDDKKKEKNKIVKRLREKGWFHRNISHRAENVAVDVVKYFGRLKLKNIAAKSFVNFIIEDLEKRGLLIDDLEK